MERVRLELEAGLPNSKRDPWLEGDRYARHPYLATATARGNCSLGAVFSRDSGLVSGQGQAVVTRFLPIAGQGGGDNKPRQRDSRKDRPELQQGRGATGTAQFAAAF
jgi:hypothetical protein